MGANDNKAYTLAEFKSFYQSQGDWVARWKRANIATQMRTADGNNYTVLEFKNYFEAQWPEKFAAAPKVACKECCGGLTHADCDLRPACMWKWDKEKPDWKTSCV